MKTEIISREKKSAPAPDFFDLFDPLPIEMKQKIWDMSTKPQINDIMKLLNQKG